MSALRTRGFGSLRVRIALVVLVAVIPGFILSFIAARDERNNRREQAQDASRTIVASTSARYDSLLSQSRTLLQALGAVPSNLFADSGCPAVLATMVNDSDTYDDFLIARDDGAIVCSAEPDDPTVGSPAPEWFTEALASGAFVVSSHERGGESSAPLVTTALAVDGVDGRYVLAVRFSLTQLGRVVANASFPKDSSVTLLDADDTVLYRGPGVSQFIGERVSETDVVRRLRAAGGSGTISARGTDGVKRVYAYQTLSAPEGAVVYAGIPTSVAFADASHDFAVRLLALSIGALVALIIAISFADLTIGRRVRSLVALTRQFGAGDLTARSNVGSGDEVATLGQALDAMAADLRARDEERGHLLGAIVNASEEERRRIAGDVHDDSIQVMSAHVMALQLLRRRVEDPELQERIRELEESGRAATSRLRDLVFDLHSPVLETQGLQAALDLLLDRTFEGEPVEWSVSSSLTGDPPPASRDTAYRIAQEAIGNARRHAQPHRVTIDLRRDGPDLVLRVSDDGRGFTPTEMEERPGHLGLRAARERAAAVGGAIAIDSDPGRGTRFVCRLPWTLDGAAPAEN